MRTIPITIAHDYFTQRGGAERVAAALIEAVQPDRVVTALYSAERTFNLSAEITVETTFLQRIRAIRTDPRRALLVFPLAWASVKPVDRGVVICSTSGWAHGIPTSRPARKIVYCHNPARWLYQPADFFKDQSSAIRWAALLARPLLKRWDQHVARSADLYIANSTAVANRIMSIYGRPAEVVHPPISIDAEGEQRKYDSLEPGYFLTVGRGRGYKNLDVLVRAFAQMPSQRLVVVGEPSAEEAACDNVEFTKQVDDSTLRWLYANARALISVSHEDFGLTPLEANALGTPALLLRAGGFLDSLREGVNGLFIEQATPEAVVRAVQNFPDQWNRDLIKESAQAYSVPMFTARILELADRTVR